MAHFSRRCLDRVDRCRVSLQPLHWTIVFVVQKGLCFLMSRKVPAKVQPRRQKTANSLLKVNRSMNNFLALNSEGGGANGRKEIGRNSEQTWLSTGCPLLLNVALVDSGRHAHLLARHFAEHTLESLPRQCFIPCCKIVRSDLYSILVTQVIPARKLLANTRLN